jgi:hypothetical protein
MRLAISDARSKRLNREVFVVAGRSNRLEGCWPRRTRLRGTELKRLAAVLRPEMVSEMIDPTWTTESPTACARSISVSAVFCWSARSTSCKVSRQYQSSNQISASAMSHRVMSSEPL